MRAARDLLSQSGLRAQINRDDDGVITVDVPDDPNLGATLEAMLSMASQRDRAREEAERIEERFTTNQRISHVGSYDWHIPTDTNLWTDSLFRIYGEEPGSFQPSYAEFLARVHPDDRERIQAIHQEAFQNHSAYEMHERIVRPDGKVRTLLSRGEVIVDETGTPVRMVGVCEDVTEQLAEEARIAELRDEATRQEQRRATALELNDDVVQGLTAVAWALDGDLIEPAKAAAHRTLVSAREMLSRLLPDGTGLVAGDLVRTKAAPRVLDQ